MGLTKKRQLFVAEFLANPGKPAAWAAVRAGFSEKRAKETASELLKDPEIQEAIERKMVSKFETIAVDQKLVRAELLRHIDRCKAAGSGSWQSSGILKCLELLGRELKMWTEKVEVGFDEELIKLLEAGRKRAALPTAEDPK